MWTDTSGKHEHSHQQRDGPHESVVDSTPVLSVDTSVAQVENDIEGKHEIPDSGEENEAAE